MPLSNTSVRLKRAKLSLICQFDHSKQVIQQRTVKVKGLRPPYNRDQLVLSSISDLTKNIENKTRTYVKSATPGTTMPGKE